MRFIIPSFAMNNQHVTQTISHGLLNETEHHFAALFHRLAQKIQARLLRIFTTAQLIQHPMLQPFPPKLQRLT
ncbi:Uncharacterised protein [Shigella sonnei]|nr:Uncharacterised protein [Shigella sonnei]CSK26415.1 Uncharacterised protein [Shigella sonnei]